MSCCPHDSTPKKPVASCCSTDAEDGHAHHDKRGLDWLLWISLTLVIGGYATHLLKGSLTPPDFIIRFGDASFELLNAMWWGVAAGIFFVGIMGRIPREFVMSILGKGGTASGVLRATMGGVLLDLCSHGILLVGMKLYERGASLGQIMAFLIASPWNSFSLTLILIALIGLPWTLLFITLSIIIAIVSGLIFEMLVKRGVLPDNPHRSDIPEDFRFVAEAKKQLSATRWSPTLLIDMLKEGARESAPVLRWVFVGVVLAGLLRAGVSDAHFAHYFGASFGGLALTMIAATVIEVCSEGSTPIAADILTRAAAPGNSFAFLMAGVSTDYTEIMAIKETTHSWKIALFLPLVTLPQVFILAWIINVASQ